MTARIANIWRYPIKGHGREEIPAVTLSPGQTLPWDRCWAVRHRESSADATAWAPPANFSRGAKAPGLMAIDASLNETDAVLTLTHPTHGSIGFRPDDNPAAFFEWVQPMMPPDRAPSAQIIRVPGRGMTDSDFPSVSLLNLSSHRAVGHKVGREISPRRWRGNFWIEGLAPWEEFEWIGRHLRLGNAVVEVKDRILRCLATAASPTTGQRDVDTLGTLNAGWGHQDFGVYAQVVEGGQVRSGDPIARVS